MKSRHSKHRRFSIALLFLSLGSAPASVAQTPGGGVPALDSNEAAFRRLSNSLLCQCGSCNYLVASCNHLDCASATYIRKTIQNSLAAGKSEEVIMASFAQEYGPRILPEPPRQGFNWLAWVMPFVGLFLGGGAVSYVLWRWKRKPEEVQESDEDLAVPPAAADQSPSSLIEKYRAQIDQELEEE